MPKNKRLPSARCRTKRVFSKSLKVGALSAALLVTSGCPKLEPAPDIGDTNQSQAKEVSVPLSTPRMSDPVQPTSVANTGTTGRDARVQASVPSCFKVPRVGPLATLVSLTPIDPHMVQNGGSFDSVLVTGKIEGGNPDNRLVLRNCVVRGGLLWGGALTMENCRIEGQVVQVPAWSPDWDTDPTLNRWAISHSHMRGNGKANGEGQGLRLDGKVYGDNQHSREVLVEDSIIEIDQTQLGMHAEAMQALGGRGHTFRRVLFRNLGVFNGSQTAVVTSLAANVLYEDSAFLAAPVLPPAQAATGQYTIYAAEKTLFRRNVIQNGLTGRFFGPHVQQGNILDGGGNLDESCRPIAIP